MKQQAQKVHNGHDYKNGDSCERERFVHASPRCSGEPMNVAGKGSELSGIPLLIIFSTTRSDYGSREWAGERLRCAECGGSLQSVKLWRLADVIGKPQGRRG
jgi:hypothetical protein